MKRYLRLSALLAVLAAALVIAPAAQAKTRTVSLNVTAVQKGTAVSGTYSGSPWGSGKISGTLVIPTATITFKTKGGTATMRYKGVVKGAGLTARWSWIKGTGKLKGIKGSGTMSGDLRGHLRYKGTAKY